MDKEIKERIAAINSGIIPEGYKKTKVGIVPVEWEVTKLSEYLYVNKKKNTELKYSKNDVFSISGEYGIVNQIDFLGRSFAGVSVEPYRVVYPENIVYTKSPLKANPYGIIKSNQRKDTGIVSTLYAVYHCKENVLSKYVEYYFGLDVTLNNFLLPLVNIGSKHDMKISDENVLKGLVVFPPLPEQQKIAEILSTQDKLIELQEKKIEQLKKLKKAYLQKMFPQKGSKYPELRFKGFTDPWEQCKLGKLIENGIIIEQSDGNHGELYPRAEEFTEKGIPYISASSISADGESIDFNLTKYLPIERAKQFRKGVAKNGDILLAHNATVGPAVLLSMNYEFAILSTSLTLYRLDDKKMNSYYFLQAIRSRFFQIQLETFMAQTTRNQVPILTQRNLLICYPTNINEQEKIGEFLLSFDKHLALHQYKLEQEKQKKKALMQLLLTGIVRTK